FFLATSRPSLKSLFAFGRVYVLMRSQPAANLNKALCPWDCYCISKTFKCKMRYAPGGEKVMGVEIERSLRFFRPRAWLWSEA
ncbi:MAG: hypothetical protein MUO29_03480, partial [Desulfobacterales bacterium]|nr:hypothetical protein [Desulfobacterales bacterium]